MSDPKKTGMMPAPVPGTPEFDRMLAGDFFENAPTEDVAEPETLEPLATPTLHPTLQ